MKKYFLVSAIFLSLEAFPLKPASLQVPDGFAIEIFAKDIDAPRQMAQGDRDFIFVGSRKAGELIVIKDFDNNGVSDYKRVVANSLNQPSGVSFHEGDIYFSEIDKIWKIENIEEWLDRNSSGMPEKVLVSSSLPDDEWHGWKWIAHNQAGDQYL